MDDMDIYRYNMDIYIYIYRQNDGSMSEWVDRLLDDMDICMYMSIYYKYQHQPTDLQDIQGHTLRKEAEKVKTALP